MIARLHHGFSGMLRRDGFGRVQQGLRNKVVRSEPSSREAPDFSLQDREANSIKKILVPTDFSPCAECAFHHAVALAEQCHAAITLLYALDVSAHMPGWGPAEPAKVAAELRRTGAEQLRRMVGRLPANKVEVNTLLVEGLPCEAIAEAARAHDLVIIGRAMHKRLWHLFSRHTFRGLMELAPCPLLIIREPEPGGPNQDGMLADGQERPRTGATPYGHEKSERIVT